MQVLHKLLITRVLEGRNLLYPTPQVNRMRSREKESCQSLDLHSHLHFPLTDTGRQVDMKEEGMGWTNQPLRKSKLRRTPMDILKENLQIMITHRIVRESAFVRLYYCKSHWTYFLKPNKRKDRHVDSKSLPCNFYKLASDTFV